MHVYKNTEQTPCSLALYLVIFSVEINQWMAVLFVVKKYYTKYRDNTICEVFAPHLHIYLDAPVKVLRERINKRNKVTRPVSLTVLFY